MNIDIFGALFTLSLRILILYAEFDFWNWFLKLIFEKILKWRSIRPGFSKNLEMKLKKINPSLHLDGLLKTAFPALYRVLIFIAH